MSAALLLACISAALLAQLAIGIGVFAWRRRGGAATIDAIAAPAPHIAPGAWRELRVVGREFEDEGQTQCSFHLEPVDGAALPPFQPGQFLTFSLQTAARVTEGNGGERTMVRCYSLSDRPNPHGYRITVKRVPAPSDRPDLPPGLSSGHFHDHVQVGDVLKAKAPSGHFHLDPEEALPIVLLAGGIGITPLMSMLGWCLDAQPARVVHLYYGIRTLEEQAFRGALAALAQAHPRFHLNLVVSRPGPDALPGRDFQHAGHVDLDLLRRTLPAGRHLFYVCGPAAMMETLVPALARWGVPQGDIHFEAFGPAAVQLAEPTPQASAPRLAAPLDVRFLRSGRTLAWTAQDGSLLEFAERHGIAPDSGCRSGSCGSCETRLVSGTVHYANPPDHDIAPGHCLLCVGTPASALVLEA